MAMARLLARTTLSKLTNPSESPSQLYRFLLRAPLKPKTPHIPPTSARTSARTSAYYSGGGGGGSYSGGGGGSSSPEPATDKKGPFPWAPMGCLAAAALSLCIRETVRAPTPLGVAVSFLGSACLGVVVLRKCSSVGVLLRSRIQQGRASSQRALEYLSSLSDKFTWDLLWLLAVTTVAHSACLVLPQPSPRGLFCLGAGSLSVMLMTLLAMVRKFVPTRFMPAAYCLPIFLLIVLKVGLLLDYSASPGGPVIITLPR